ncbi:MAG: hypothetical protein AAGE52_42295 [Myxococcota bacterium]
MRWTAILLCAACGGGGSDPELPATFEEACAMVDGCMTPDNAIPGGREAIWRVHVIREADGSYRLGDIVEAEIAEVIGAPQGPLDGEVALAALGADGTATELQLLRFADVLEIEAVDGLEDIIEVPLTGVPVDTIGYLAVSDAATRIAVVEPDGTVLAEIPAPAPGEAVRTDVRGSDALIRPAPEGPCAHVVLIEGLFDSFGYYNDWFQENYPLQVVTPTQEAVVRAALGRMQPIHCAGISRIAFVEIPMDTGTAGLVSVRAGDLVLLNVRADYDGLNFGELSLQAPGQRARLEHVIFHEGGHAMEWLLNSEVAPTQWVGEWSPTQRSLAAETVDRVRLRGGFGRAWRQLHGGFFGAGWAESYLLGPALSPLQRQMIRGLDPEGMARYGMVSQYATKSHHEDIAETLSYPLSAPLMRAAGLPDGPPPQVNDYACIAMRDYAEANVPQRLAAVYAKLLFLRDLGALTDEAVEACAGSAIGLEADTEGITILQDGAVQRTFTANPEAMIGTRDDRYVFVMTVQGGAEFDGETFPAELRLELDLGGTSLLGDEIPVEKIAWPRGLYELSSLQPHSFTLRLTGAPAGNFDVTDGFVLVTDATNERIVGSVFARQAFRGQAPVPVPQTFDPPLTFRFLLSN